MAELYLAHSSGAGGFKKQVVVKRILPQLAESEELFQMFLDEARIAATLQHANIVQVYDACEDDGEFFMAMEYLDGTDLRTLRRVLANSEMAIGWEHSLHIVSSIASGLHYAHEKCALDGTPLRIVHRDVSPQNIFLTREGSVKLVDFGIAKAEGRTTETAMGTLKGKLAYMAPEQCASHEVDRRADIYSLGVILYELTTGRRLYSSKTEYQLINEIVEGKIRVPSTFMDYPSELERIVLTCLKKDPTERYDSARDIQADLNVFARDYQLICSTLGFSVFLEPLLEQARVEADERCKHRKEIRPIRVKGSALHAAPATAKPKDSPEAWGSYFEASEPDPVQPAAKPDSGPFVLPPAPPRVDRADEIIEDFLSAKHKPAPHRRARASSTPLAVNTSYINTGANLLEDLTRPVPTDMLERIRREERMRSQDEQDESEKDAIPRLARGSMSGEVSVSTHIVRRDTGRSVIVQTPQGEAHKLEAFENEVTRAESADIVFEAIIEDDIERAKVPEAVLQPGAKLVPQDADIEFAKVSNQQLEARSTPAAPIVPAGAKVRPKALEQARVATALVAPVQFDVIDQEDLSIRPKRSKLWLGAGIVAGAGIAAALFLGNTQKQSIVGMPPVELVKPELGSLTIQATSEAEVWLYLGKTPLKEVNTHGEEALRLRVEHEGYQGQEKVLGPDQWSRNSKGDQVAVQSFQLQPKENALAVENSGASPSPALGDATPPQALSIDSSPSAADTWLYVGTTPDVQIQELKTSEKVDVRIVQTGQPPMYRSVPASKFDSEGRASLHLILASPAAGSETRKATLPVAPRAQEVAPDTVTPTAAKKRWRPKRKTQAPASAEPKRSAPLEHPAPDWAR